MDEYFIGAGALLTAGTEAGVRSATLHAQTGVVLAERVRAALVDFEGGSLTDLSRVVVAAAGWTAARFRSEVMEPLISRRDCELEDILATLARAAGDNEVHVFARWDPDQAMVARLRGEGVTVCCHPLEDLGPAALVCGQRLERWRPARAA